ncbi:hypothetical protein BDW62DRAFT_215977 [Aspergillus aurantiobrunneus]
MELFVAAGILLGAGGAFALPPWEASTTPPSSPCPTPSEHPAPPAWTSTTTTTTLSASSSTSLFSSTSTSSSGSGSASASATATPSSSAGVSEMCSTNNVDLWTRDNYNSKNVTEWYNEWAEANLQNGDHVDETFAGYWGLGPGFSCNIDKQCQAPECNRLVRPEESSDYERAAMFLGSMANFNAHYSRVYEALDGGKIDFGAIQAHLQQTFHPNTAIRDMAAIQALSGGSVAIGLVSAWSGPLSPAANTAKEIYNGVARGITATLTAADESVSNMADLGSAFSKKIDEVRKQLVTVHDDIVKQGITGEVPIDTVFDGGSYVDDREIAILHDLSVEDVRSYVREMFFSMIISNAWVQQGVYIFSREMDEETCKGYEVKDREGLPEHVCYNGRIYWLNKYGNSTATKFGAGIGVDPPPGWESLESEIGATIEDVMLSSIDAFNAGGYKYDASETDMDEIFNGDIREKMEIGSRLKGVWNIPVCEIESSAQYEDTGLTKDGSTGDIKWDKVERNRQDFGTRDAGIQFCLCSTATDHNGVSITELESFGDRSFRHLFDLTVHDECQLEHGLSAK